VGSTLVVSRNVAVDESQKSCVICHEAFEQYLDDEEGEWMFRGVVRLPALNSAPIIADNEAAQQEHDRLRNAITLPHIRLYAGRLVHGACLEPMLLHAPTNILPPNSPSPRSFAAKPFNMNQPIATAATASAAPNNSNNNGHAAVPSLSSFVPLSLLSAPSPLSLSVAASSSSLSSDVLMSVASPAHDGRRMDLRMDDNDTSEVPPLEAASPSLPPSLSSAITSVSPTSSTSSSTTTSSARDSEGPILLSSFQAKCVCPSADIRSMNCRIHLAPDSPARTPTTPSLSSFVAIRDIPSLTPSLTNNNATSTAANNNSANNSPLKKGSPTTETETSKGPTMREETSDANGNGTFGNSNTIARALLSDDDMPPPLE
jgi:hypothetical protein